jgi:hypothetical protein
VIVGIPRHVEPPDGGYPNVEREDGLVRILHAPSHPSKGTAEIREMIESLRRKGYRIEFVEITGRPNHEVQQEIARCDFVIDQLYSDLPMASFAGEAALQCKPTVIGGYYAELMKHDLPAHLTPPSHFCFPEEMEEGIERMIVDEEYRRELGERARQFMLEYWSPEAVAKNFLRLISGDIPEEWMFDPRDLRYMHGYGMRHEVVREKIRQIIDTYGVEALGLQDKPELQQMYVDLANGDDSSVQPPRPVHASQM